MKPKGKPMSTPNLDKVCTIIEILDKVILKYRIADKLIYDTFNRTLVVDETAEEAIKEVRLLLNIEGTSKTAGLKQIIKLGEITDKYETVAEVMQDVLGSEIETAEAELEKVSNTVLEEIVTYLKGETNAS